MLGFFLFLCLFCFSKHTLCCIEVKIEQRIAQAKQLEEEYETEYKSLTSRFHDLLKRIEIFSMPTTPICKYYNIMNEISEDLATFRYHPFSLKNESYVEYLWTILDDQLRTARSTSIDSSTIQIKKANPPEPYTTETIDSERKCLENHYENIAHKIRTGCYLYNNQVISNTDDVNNHITNAISLFDRWKIAPKNIPYHVILVTQLMHEYNNRTKWVNFINQQKYGDKFPKYKLFDAPEILSREILIKK